MYTFILIDLPYLTTIQFHFCSCGQLVTFDISQLPSLTSVVVDDGRSEPYHSGSLLVLRSLILTGIEICLIFTITDLPQLSSVYLGIDNVAHAVNMTLISKCLTLF